MRELLFCVQNNIHIMVVVSGNFILRIELDQTTACSLGVWWKKITWSSARKQEKKNWCVKLNLPKAAMTQLFAQCGAVSCGERSNGNSSSHSLTTIHRPFIEVYMCTQRNTYSLCLMISRYFTWTERYAYASMWWVHVL